MSLIHAFDLGNVLLFVDETLFFRRVQPHCRSDTELTGLFPEYYERFRVDRGDDFDALYEQLVRDVELDMTSAQFRLAWNDIFTPNPPMLDFVGRTPHPRVLLSNTNEPHVAWIRERYPDIFPLFDHCVLSNEVGMHKPDVEIYRHVESLTGQPPEQHLFIDDSPQHVAGARKAGWHAVQFRDFDDCRRQLAALGIPT